MSRYDDWRWPPPPQLNPLTKKESDDYKVWKKGQLFVLRGGKYDGCLLRLFPGPYPDDPKSSGWDEIMIEGERYVRPEGVDPYQRRLGKPNRKRTNVPMMQYASEQALAA